MRPGWDSYFIELAHTVAKRSTCDRASVGCILVKDKQIISTGYNGSISGHDHCDTAGHIIINDSCQRALHAEENSIASAARRGSSVENATAYITHFPCWRCFRQLANSGISKIIFDEWKSNKTTEEILAEIKKSKIDIRSIKEPLIKDN